MKPLREALRNTPALGPTLRHAKQAYDRRRFVGSATYWEEHYRQGGTSGPGSAGVNAEFKANTLNRFVEANSVSDVIEFGCGDGRQLELAAYPHYVGLDISETSIAMCRAKFSHDTTKQFHRYPSESVVPGKGVFAADLTLSLDVIYHLVEDTTFEQYMNDVFTASRHWVILYTSDSDRVQQITAPHCRHRPVARYVAATFPAWEFQQHIINANPWTGDLEQGSLADFYVYERHHP